MMAPMGEDGGEQPSVHSVEASVQLSDAKSRADCVALERVLAMTQRRLDDSLSWQKLWKARYKSLIGNGSKKHAEDMAAKLSRLTEAFDVRKWSIEQSHAWHRAIPDTAKAFRDLYEATTAPDSSGSVPLAANQINKESASPSPNAQEE